MKVISKELISMVVIGALFSIASYASSYDCRFKVVDANGSMKTVISSEIEVNGSAIEKNEFTLSMEERSGTLRLLVSKDNQPYLMGMVDSGVDKFLIVAQNVGKIQCQNIQN